MHYSRTARAAAAALALATLAAGPARAQDAVDHFGGNEGTTTIGALSFIGLPYPDTNGFSQFTYVFPGGGVIGTALVELPNGAEITQLCVVGYDSSPHGAVTLSLIGWEYPRVGTATPTASRILTTASTGAVAIPGMTTACAPIAAPILVKSFGDVDANGV